MSQSQPQGHGIMPPPPSTPSPPPGTLGYPLTTSTSSSGLSSLGSGIHTPHHSVPPSPDHSLPEGDEAVQATNDDASICKRSAVQLGYWADPYLQYFMRGPVIRKPPEINRGYYARSHGVYQMILKTLEKIANSDVVFNYLNLRTFSAYVPFRSGWLIFVCALGVYSQSWAWRRKP